MRMIYQICIYKQRSRTFRQGWIRTSQYDGEVFWSGATTRLRLPQQWTKLHPQTASHAIASRGDTREAKQPVIERYDEVWLLEEITVSWWAVGGGQERDRNGSFRLLKQVNQVLQRRYGQGYERFLCFTLQIIHYGSLCYLVFNQEHINSLIGRR